MAWAKHMRQYRRQHRRKHHRRSPLHVPSVRTLLIALKHVEPLGSETAFSTLGRRSQRFFTDFKVNSRPRFTPNLRPRVDSRSKTAPVRRPRPRRAQSLNLEALRYCKAAAVVCDGPELQSTSLHGNRRPFPFREFRQRRDWPSDMCDQCPTSRYGAQPGQCTATSADALGRQASQGHVCKSAIVIGQAASMIFSCATTHSWRPQYTCQHVDSASEWTFRLAWLFGRHVGGAQATVRNLSRALDT